MAAIETALPPIDAYELHPCVVVGQDQCGQDILETCDEDSPNIACWSVYSHRTGIGLESVSDHKTLSEAVKEWKRLESILIGQPEAVKAPQVRRTP